MAVYAGTAGVAVCDDMMLTTATIHRLHYHTEVVSVAAITGGVLSVTTCVRRQHASIVSRCRCPLHIHDDTDTRSTAVVCVVVHTRHLVGHVQREECTAVSTQAGDVESVSKSVE